MNKVTQWLLQPYPFERRWKKALGAGLWAGVFVALFLFLFRPFGARIQEGEELYFLGYCTLFGLVTFLMTLLVHGFCLLLPSIFEEEKWRIWKEILFNFFFIGCIGFGNLVLVHFIWDVPLNGRTFWIWQGLTFAVGIFPALLGAFLGQMKLNRKYVSEAALLSMQVHPPTAPSHQAVTLTGDNQNELLRLDAGQIAWLSAADNYVQVFYFEKGALKNRMFRTTLKKMEEVLSNCPQFFRCHRTYIVNLEMVREVSGNAQGYRLHLNGVDTTIPVSRNFNEAIQTKLTNL